MRNIDGRLNALEKQVKGKKQQGHFCTEHARPPVIVYDKDTPPEIPVFCSLCGKPYPPDTSPLILDFTDTGIDDTWG